MKKLNFLRIFLVALLTVSLNACDELHEAFATKLNKTSESPKNIILVIGDGMGPQQIGLLQSYAKQAAKPQQINNRNTAFELMLDRGAELGVSMTYPASNLVVDSAASASQIATATFSGSEMIGLNQNGSKEVTLLEKAKAKGMMIGLVSDTRLTHATPAAFAAHQSHRSKESEIAEDMLKLEPDVMLSGGLRYWLPKEVNSQETESYLITKQLMANSFEPVSKRKDSKNLIQEALGKGYSIAFNREQMLEAQSKVLGLFSNSGMANGIVHSQK